MVAAAGCPRFLLMYRVLLTAFVIVGVCVVMHTTVLVGMGEWLIGRREAFEMKKGTVRDTSYVIGVFSIITFLHLVEIGISGVLLCGLSGAFLFVLINAILEIRQQQKSKS